VYNGEPSGVEPVTENSQVVFPVAAAPLCSGVQDPHQACAFETNITIRLNVCFFFRDFSMVM